MKASGRATACPEDQADSFATRATPERDGDGENRENDHEGWNSITSWL